MKKALLLTGLLLVLVAPLSMANTTGGLSLNWGTNCWGDGPQVSLMTFACASNTSPANWRMTASFKLDSDMPDWINWDEKIVGVSELADLPDWWLLAAPGTCRTTISNVFTNTQAYSGSGADCVNPFDGVGVFIGGTNYVVMSADSVLIQAANTLLAGTPVPGGQENFISTITIKNGKTVGTGSCAGCSAGFVFGFWQLLIGTEASEVGYTRITEPYTGGNQCLTWQHAWADQPCNAPVPARNTTWGQVKSLYR